MQCFCFVRLDSFLPLCRSDWSEVDKNQVLGLGLTASSSSSFLARLPCSSSMPPWQKLFDLWLSVMINRRTKFSNVPPDRLHVLPVLADRYRGKVQLSRRLWNRLQARDRPLALPVGEDVLGKDCRRHQSQDHQDWPYHPCEMGILQQVLDSWGIYSKALEFYNTHHEWRNFLHSSSEGWPQIGNSKIPSC